ncbi:exopolyphosphatase [Roseivirga sp. BDSF3-8]|uniref:Ppx/GppA phosphatase family protein n=1 Tax=Roseivirga sp. BDSF3-8 TaxID=3241598 RepID=UPI003531B460
MGTNTFHLLIVLTQEKGFVVERRERVAVKIGKGGINEGFITKSAWKRAIDALLGFKGIIENSKVDEVFATATSAIRNARNGKDLASEISERTGIPVRIISGEQEAEYIYFGVKQALPLGKENSLIMDIGGGSVEFIIGNETEVYWKKSYEIGAQRLLDLFHAHDPILEKDIKRLEEYLQEKLFGLSDAIVAYSPKTLIGSSGTFDTLSDIYLIKNNLEKEPGATEYPLPVSEYKSIHADLLTKDRSQRLLIPGMADMRVDMIVVASCLINHILHTYGFSQMRASAFALKEGVLHHIIHSIRKNLNSHSDVKANL